MSPPFLRKTRCVSVWIGDFINENSLEEYLFERPGFESDYGFSLGRGTMPETLVLGDPQPISSLVNGFSDFQSYGDAIIAESEYLNVAAVSTMVIFFNIQYFPRGDQTMANKPLKFLCSVTF